MTVNGSSRPSLRVMRWFADCYMCVTVTDAGLCVEATDDDRQCIPWEAIDRLDLEPSLIIGFPAGLACTIYSHNASLVVPPTRSAADLDRVVCSVAQSALLSVCSRGWATIRLHRVSPMAQDEVAVLQPGEVAARHLRYTRLCYGGPFAAITLLCLIRLVVGWLLGL
jgi:hypothetical protein